MTQNKREFQKIRPILPRDRSAIAQILIENKMFTHEEVKVALELIDHTLQKADQKDYEIYSAVDPNDEVLGYVCLGPTPMTDRTYDLYWIAVDPLTQSHGIGKKLMQFVEHILEKQKARLLLIETSSQLSYQKTQNFYKHQGYEEVARVKDFYKDGDDRIVYCKRFS